MMDNADQPAPVPPPKPQTVPTASLRANPHNPRLLFDEADLATLLASIRKVGILVPLTVYKARGSDKFTILDGQRRWVCASRLGMQEVPINEVPEPSLVQNIVTMFQIHKLRKDWELMPTALKLGVLIDELKESGDRELSELTGLDIAVVSRCKKLLSFETRYQDAMLDPEPEKRLKADLFIEMYPIISDRSVRAASWYDRGTLIDTFIHKYQNKKSGFQAVTDFRKIKAYLTAGRKNDQVDIVIDKLKRFLRDDNMLIEELQVDEARVHSDAVALSRRVDRIIVEIEEIDPDVFAAEEEVWESIERLAAAVRQKLEEAERRAL